MTEPLTVLVVDDDVLVRRALTRDLRGRGCAVVQAGGVEAALRILDERVIDVVILDVCLGARSGVEVAEHAWRMRLAPAVVAISGLASRGEVFALGQLGVRAFIDKAELSERMGELLELARRPTRLEPQIKGQVGHVPIHDAIGAVRTQMLAQALAKSSGSTTKAGRELGISRQAVQQMVGRRRNDSPPKS